MISRDARSSVEECVCEAESVMSDR